MTHKLIQVALDGTRTETPFDDYEAARAAFVAAPKQGVNDLVKVEDPNGRGMALWGTEKGCANDPEMQRAHASNEKKTKLAKSIGMTRAVIALSGVTEPEHLDRVVSKGPTTTIKGRSFAPVDLTGTVTLRDVFLAVDKALAEAGPQDAIFIETVRPSKTRSGHVNINVFMGS